MELLFIVIAVLMALVGIGCIVAEFALNTLREDIIVAAAIWLFVGMYILILV